MSYDDLHEVNSAVETVSEHLDQYVDKSSENHTVAEEGIPTVLNMLCNSSRLVKLFAYMLKCI